VDLLSSCLIYIKTTRTVDQAYKNTAAESHATWQQSTPEHLKHITGISMLIDDNDIPAIFCDKAHVEIASDSGHEPSSGISTFGWVIAVDKMIIAKGRGPAQTHPCLAELFRAEGYGLSSALIFIKNLIVKFQISPPAHLWSIYINNMALIQ
jgi:hypothetical protein